MRTAQVPHTYRIAGLSLLTVTCLVLVWWKTLTYPYIQDDWFYLYQVAHGNFMEVLKNAFSPFDKLHYRPFNTLFFLFSYKLLGLNSIGYHLLALSMHYCNALLIVFIIRKIDGSPLIAWCTGLLYCTAATIHMEPLLWAVGIQALGCALFFYVSLALFLQKHYKLSSLSFLLSLLFQEGSLFLPSVVFFYILLQDDGVSHAHILRKVTEKLWPFCLVLGFYFVLKMLGTGYLGTPESNPYKVKLFGPHVLRNCLFYLTWVAETVLPWKDIPFGTRQPHEWKMEFPLLSQTASLFLIAAAVLFIAAVGCVISWRRRIIASRNNKLLIFWLVWFLGSIGPALFFPIQIYRYYLTFASLPFIVIILTCLKRTALFFKVQEQRFARFIICYTALLIISSFFYFFKCDQEGIHHIYRGGYNNLIKKGHIVRRVWEGLLTAHSTLPRNAVLVFEELDTLWAIGFLDGPRLWYEDETVMIVYRKILKSDSRGIYFDDPISIRVTPLDTGIKSSGRIYLDPGKTFVFRFQDGYLREHAVSHIM